MFASPGRQLPVGDFLRHAQHIQEEKMAGEISGIGLVAGIEIRERPDAVVLPGKIRIS